MSSLLLFLLLLGSWALYVMVVIHIMVYVMLKLVENKSSAVLYTWLLVLVVLVIGPLVVLHFIR